MSLLINKISELLFLFVIFQLTNLRIISCFLPEAHSFSEESVSTQWLEIWMLFAL